MATVYVNGNPVDIGNERLNLIQAAQKAGVLIPHYCWHPALTVVASCRMCLVEVGERKPDGTTTMQPKVVPGCQTPAKDGTVINTNTNKAKFAQEQTLEDILLNHPLDCPVCDKAGECLLQDYTYNFGRATSRMIDDKNTPPNKPYIGDNVTLFTDRCIMCSRCVRFTREISGTAELQIINRGHHSEIDIFPGEPLNNKLATNVVDLCPVGALCSKDFLYKHRVWNLKTKQSVCADCSTGCSIWLDGNKNIVYRLRPRVNPQAQGHFICDDGRLGYHYVNSIERFLRPMVRRAGAVSTPAGQTTGIRAESAVTGVTGSAPRPQGAFGNGRGDGLHPLPWAEVVPAIRRAFQSAAQKDAASVVGVLSPFLTCEEAYLLAKFLKGLSGQVRLALGPVPVIGEDDTYPKDRRGQPIQPVKFIIRAEKCPNRRGVEEVLRHFQGEVTPFDDIVRAAGEGRVQALYLAAGYPPREGGWMSEEQARALQSVPLVVCHDLLPSPISNFAHYVLPGAAWAEKDGTFVNHAGLAQAIHWGVTPTAEIRTDGQVFLDLLERRGLAHAPTLRKELAAEVPYFAPLAGGEPGEYGIPLEHRNG
ncbi:MAG TPA: molybdopterin-dependent oxidoreductase [Gemmataceae bacterium]|jgi:NADH-quinone oxidoreductase subunit G